MLFDTTLRRDLARGFGATLVVILTIVLTNFLIRTVGQAAKGLVAPQDVVLLLGYVTLGYMPMVLSLSLFVAVVVTLGRMYRESEMVIWFAAGVGITRFVRPVLRMAWPVLLVVGLLQFYVWPWGNRSSYELRDRYERRSDLARVAPGVFQSSTDGRSVFFVEREGAGNQNARNVFILSNLDHQEVITMARSGQLVTEGEDRYLVLDHGQRSEIDARSGHYTLSSFETYRTLASQRSRRASSEAAPKTLATADLVRLDTPRNRGELTWRIGMMLGAANLLLLGIGLAATNPRLASNWNLLFALLAYVAYYNLINLSQAWVAGGKVSLPVAVAGLHLPVLGCALALLWWRDHAAVTPPWRREATVRRPAAA
jgi:lipopolysaccharide export system permease protein